MHTTKNVIIALYVDDMIILAKEMSDVQEIKDHLSREYNMKDLGEVRNVLGLRVQRDRSKRTLWIDQTHYIEETLRAFQLENCKEVSTPADGYDNLQAATTDKALFDDVHLYRRALGQLNWLVRGTRPDLAFVVHKLSQHCQSPSMKHWSGVKRVLRYLQHTKTMRLRYSVSNNSVCELFGYADADYAGDSADRKSTMGYAYLLHGGAITWSTRKQQSVATSTTEAEYMGLCNAAKEAVWLRNLLASLGFEEYAAQGTLIYGDNQGSLRLVANPEMHARSKHIDVQYHYVRELAEQGMIKVEYIPTAEMAADCLTKPLKRQLHERNMELLGLEKGVS